MGDGGKEKAVHPTTARHDAGGDAGQDGLEALQRGLVAGAESHRPTIPTGRKGGTSLAPLFSAATSHWDFAHGRKVRQGGEVAEWPAGRARHGGLDEIPLPTGPGRLWLCGKHFVAPDPAGALLACDADQLVCLCERDELEGRYPEYVAWLVANQGAGARWYPVADLHAPSLEEAELFLDDLYRLIRSGHSVLMHCGAGIGRAGTLAAALLIRMGAPVRSALSTVAGARPMAGPEAGVQSELLERLAARQDRTSG